MMFGIVCLVTNWGGGETVTKIYACLIGDWVCLNDDTECKIGSNRSSPYIWWEENADIFAPFERVVEHTLYQFPYVDVIYKSKKYRVSPYLIQIVEE